MENIINKENFISYHINNFIELFYKLKEDYKLLGIMDNSKVEYFIQIILDNIIFLDNNESEDESNYESEDELYESEY